LNIVKSYVEAASEAVGGALTILEGEDSWPILAQDFYRELL